MRNASILYLLFISLLLTSCEGFKILSLHNSSKNTARIILKPKVNILSQSDKTSYPSIETKDSVTILLEPDSTILLHTNFTFLLFNLKIKEDDLNFNYLRIETPTDTIIANSKAEIIELIKDERTRYVRKADKDKNLVYGKNINAIFIRK